MSIAVAAGPALSRTASRMALVPLFLVAAAAVGVEIALTRFFALAGWSEYGYWVISIAMSGFAVSGVVMVLGREGFTARAATLLPALPLAMLAAGAAGWIAAAANPFNPLELQNPATAGDQLWWIAGYYAALFPFFFLAGLAVSLNFVVHAEEVGRVYGYDLLGAGFGAVAALLLMFVLHPFALVPALLPLLALSAWIAAGPSPRRQAWRMAALGTTAAALTAIGLLAAPRISEFKPIYAPLNVPDARIVAEWLHPRGHYALLDNFTERLDTDVSNNADTLGAPPPPRAYGLYRDGARIAALPRPGAISAGHAASALDAAPYALLDAPRVLALGAAGGFRAAEALALGASHVTLVEPEPMLRRALAEGLGPSPPLAPDPRVALAAVHPLTVAGTFDLVDISGDFLAADEPNRHLYAAEALAAPLARLGPGGLLSVPVGIRQLPAYAVRVIATAQAALRMAGVADPAAHLAIIRSAWNLRGAILARDPLDAAAVAALVAFAEARSFDIPHAPGLPPGREVWNDLPPVALEDDSLDTSVAADAVAVEAALLLAGTPRQDAFDRSPVTADRPWLTPVVRAAALPAALARVELLPQPEIGLLVNAAVLAQEALLALLVAALPLLARRSLAIPAPILGRALVYFPALGLGSLMIEIALIEQAGLLLGDRTSGFALVLTTMLVFSGLGAMLAGRVSWAGRALALAAVAAMAGCLAALLLGRPVVLAALDWPFAARVLLLVAAIAPLSLALGLPFPLGLDRFQKSGAGLLPWAWALNGAFSVVATPLANLMAHAMGLSSLFLAGFACYALTVAAWPPALARSRS